MPIFQGLIDEPVALFQHPMRVPAPENAAAAIDQISDACGEGRAEGLVEERIGGGKLWDLFRIANEGAKPCVVL